jgi:hypothetical protein
MEPGGCQGYGRLAATWRRRLTHIVQAISRATIEKFLDLKEKRE